MLAPEYHISLAVRRQTERHDPILHYPKNHPTGALKTIKIHSSLGSLLDLASTSRILVNIATTIPPFRKHHGNNNEGRRLRVP